MALIDVANINADASCLSSAKWLKILSGGKRSVFYQMIYNYVKYDRKVVLGITGMTIKDLLVYNPEVINLINAHTDIFEIVFKPFAHDLAPLRTKNGFILNLEQGIDLIKNTMKNTINIFLQNEVMILNSQLEILKKYGMQGVFIRPERYNKGIRHRIPTTPYYSRGTNNIKMLTIPFEVHGDLQFLRALQGSKDFDYWIDINKSRNVRIQWRDGESCLLIPDGVIYEGLLLKEEKKHDVRRYFISDRLAGFYREADNENNIMRIKSFPYHPLEHWLKDFKVFWILEKIRDFEKEILNRSPFVQKLWLMTINSDIMSSSEKDAPKLHVRREIIESECDKIGWDGVVRDEEKSMITLLRSERYFEGEEYLELLTNVVDNRLSEDECREFIRDATEPYWKKVFARVMVD